MAEVASTKNPMHTATTATHDELEWLVQFVSLLPHDNTCRLQDFCGTSPTWVTISSIPHGPERNLNTNPCFLNNS